MSSETGWVIGENWSITYFQSCRQPTALCKGCAVCREILCLFAPIIRLVDWRSRENCHRLWVTSIAIPEERLCSSVILGLNASWYPSDWPEVELVRAEMVCQTQIRLWQRDKWLSVQVKFRSAFCHGNKDLVLGKHACQKSAFKRLVIRCETRQSFLTHSHSKVSCSKTTVFSFRPVLTCVILADSWTTEQWKEIMAYNPCNWKYPVDSSRPLVRSSIRVLVSHGAKADNQFSMIGEHYSSSPLSGESYASLHDIVMTVEQFGYLDMIISVVTVHAKEDELSEMGGNKHPLRRKANS